MDAAIARRGIGASAAPFVATSFLGAALIFLVQPMFAKMATPLLGGAPAVWNVSLVCFQAALLAGYAYAHALSRVKSGRTQIIIHGVVLAVGFLCLPLGISGLMGEPDANNPTGWLIGTFAVSILPPFAAISATAPLVQHWYARSGMADAADPYHLYAPSNIAIRRFIPGRANDNSANPAISISGYSNTPSKITGASSALNAPPSTPPSDMIR
jgi:hypothetical protein